MATFEKTTGVANMVLLENCDADKIIENLKRRLQKNIIYTYIGEVLVSVNPYKPVSAYTDDAVFKYYNINGHDNDAPHIFATTAKAYESLREYRREQCILISGESGSGKTEASKRVLQFIAKATDGDHVIQIIKDKLIVANSVLEAFGNAKTCNNDNSSRFGKYIDVQFNPMSQPVGGTIHNYLLEKSRVVKQAHNERNYHIFYQLLNGADEYLAQLLEIDNGIDYAYLRTDKNDDDNDDSNSYENYKHETVNRDSDQYKRTLQALQILEFDLDEKMNILKIIAGILHLGNIKMYEHDDKFKVENNATVRIAAELLGVSTGELVSALTTKTIEAHGEVIRSRLNAETSVFARDALAKAVYGRLFEWLVVHINGTLRAAGRREHGGGRGHKNKSMGILDIYGFEILQNNGFEQFCINYCNEKLQKLFLDLMLKSEQQEYLSEGIEWSTIEYFDNGIICDMIDERHKGIVSCLDDESFKQTDVYNNLILMNELSNRFKDHKHFVCSQSTESQTERTSILPTEFIVVHFAGPVKYDASEFLEKNNDSLYANLSHMMSNSTNEIVKSCFADCQTSNKKIPDTTIKQFKTSLNQLINTLKAKQPSYIRCIKPNNYKEPGEFDVEVVRNQVNYMGLVEVLHIRKAGFVYRSKFEEFLGRYKCLCPDTWPDWTRCYATACEAVDRLARHLGYGGGDYEIGRTKIMIKRPAMWSEIETRFDAAKHALATIVQSTWRRHAARKRYVRLRSAAIVLQRWYRRRVRCRQLRELKEYRTVVQRIVFAQKNVRRALAVRSYKRTSRAAQTINSFIRGYMTRNDPPNAYNRRFITYKRTRYLLELAGALPKNLLDNRWPEPPTCCAEVSAHLRYMHRSWLCRIYKSKLMKQPELHDLLKFKLYASELFKEKKSLYPESLKYDFVSDREGVLQHEQNASPDTTNPNVYIYATKVKKYDRRGYKSRERIMMVNAEAIVIVEKTNKCQKIKDYLPLKHVMSLQMTSGVDKFLLIKVSEQLDTSKGDILLEVPYLIECVTVISKQAPGLVHFINMQTNSCMKHDIKNSNSGFIEFIPVAVLECKGKIRKGVNGNLTITS